MNKNAFSVCRLDTIQPYKPSNQVAWFLPPELRPLKLDWNESPLPPSPSVMNAVRKFLDHPNALNWYPDANSHDLRAKLSEHWKVPEECVQTYCGSDSALHAAVRIFTKSGGAVLMVSPTYDNFRIYALEAQCSVILDGPKDIYSLSGAELSALVEKHKPQLVYLSNPNNPTGWLVPAKEIEEVVRRFPETMFIVDEAYAEFSNVTVIPLAVQVPNLVAFRTFSKAYGLAGLRIGYIIGSPGNIDYLNLIRNGKNVSMIGQVAAIAALADQDYLKEILTRVRKGEQILEAGLTRLGFPFRASPANFVLVKFPDAKKVQDSLVAQNAFVRSMSHLPGMEGYLRITLGDEEQMTRFMVALEKSL
ncbi:MAG: histidinol-phosphate aminotransferase family protein [bacterium]|nr:histidinol-phosphate aminotransferase family protein [bacterium]